MLMAAFARYYMVLSLERSAGVAAAMSATMLPCRPTRHSAVMRMIAWNRRSIRPALPGTFG